MGGDGSGRVREKETMGELLMTDRQVKERKTFKTVAEYSTVINMLMNIIRGDEKDEVFDSKNGVMVERSTSLDVRVKAAKGWKEMILDRVVSHRKVVDN